MNKYKETRKTQKLIRRFTYLAAKCWHFSFDVTNRHASHCLARYVVHLKRLVSVLVNWDVDTISAICNCHSQSADLWSDFSFTSDSDSDSVFIEHVARMIKIKKLNKQWCTVQQNITIQDKKWNAMQRNGKKWTKDSDIGLLVFQEGVMNERFVAVSTVTESGICGCFSNPRCDVISLQTHHLIR